MFLKTLPDHHKSKVRIDILRRRPQRTGCAVGYFGADEAFLFFGHVTKLSPVTAFVGIEIKGRSISGLGFKPVAKVPRSITAIDMFTKTRVIKSRPLRGLKQIFTACP